MKRLKALNWKIIVISIWLGLTLSLAGWWLTLGLWQIERLAQLTGASATEFVRQKQMMVSEGITWLILLLASGVTLLWLVIREGRQTAKIKNFFAAFSHDMKTAIASLRLQAESLKEDAGSPSTAVLDRLVADTVRLQLQLENSLQVASPEPSKLILETISMQSFVEHLAHQWPTTKIILEANCFIVGDERALSGLLSNLIQNAIVHGKATQVRIEPREVGPQRLELRVTDNGKGFAGDLSRLAEPYFRHGSRSGSGLGLYIAKTLAQQMRGNLHFTLQDRSLITRLELPGEMA